VVVVSFVAVVFVLTGGGTNKLGIVTVIGGILTGCNVKFIFVPPLAFDEGIAESNGVLSGVLSPLITDEFVGKCGLVTGGELIVRIGIR
jgi:hypothetical protein